MQATDNACKNCSSRKTCKHIGLSGRVSVHEVRDYESEVRSYSRSYPFVLKKAQGAVVYTEDGVPYIDFLSGCGSLNYGHNEPSIKQAAFDYLLSDSVQMTLDIQSVARRTFMDVFQSVILRPRGLNYKMQLPGPTGSNAVEAAVKLARKVTGRTNVVAFTNAFHGCSLGSLALTGSEHHRAASEALLSHVFRQPFDGYFGPGVDTAAQLRRLLSDPSSGISKPAAIIFETVQGEGGLNVASVEWAKSIAQIAREFDILVIVDDIQAGCGRTGTFFSFESLGIEPDIVTVSKSLSGFGLPLSLVLLRPDLDVWQPGEHNGTFRGTSLSFVTATAAIEKFWSTGALSREVFAKGQRARKVLHPVVEQYALAIKGKGLLIGVDTFSAEVAANVKDIAFKRNLIIECCGPRDEIIKLLPPLNIDDETFEQGLTTLVNVLEDVLSEQAIPLARFA